MKRVITLLLAAGLVLGAASASQAIDFKASGWFLFGAGLGDRSIADGGNDKFMVTQRVRTQIEVIADENLKGVLHFEIGHLNWGKGGENTAGNGGGGALGSDGVNLKTRYAYIDWIIPQTDVKVRVGLQNFSLPTFAGLGAVIMGGGGSDGAGVTVSTSFTENVAASLFWLRAYDQDGADAEDSLDFVGLTIPLSFDGVKFTPWGMYAAIGNDMWDGASGTGLGKTDAGGCVELRNLLPQGAYSNYGSFDDDKGDGWWVGFAAQVTTLDPFKIAVDAAYGSTDLGTVGDYDMERSGWYVAVNLEYKTEYGVPGLKFWYTSGDDDDPYDGSEQMPTIHNDIAVSTYSFDGPAYNGINCLLGTSIIGTWGAQLYWDKLSFIDNLSHKISVMYMNGTNHSAMAGKVYGDAGTAITPYNSNCGYQSYLTTEDYAIEVGIDTTWQIYKNLKMVLELGYIYLDLDEDVWGSWSEIDTYNENNFRANLQLIYQF